MTSQFIWNYDRGETVVDAAIHILGVAVAIGGGAVLIAITVHGGNIAQVTAIAIYLAGLIAMFCFSAAYNLWPVSPVKWWLRRLDHSAIYLLIAATYTLFMLPIHGATPTAVLAIIWVVALAGITIKLFWPGRFDRTSIGLYLAMGWSGLFAIGPIAAALAPATLLLIAVGGAFYSAGVVFHVWRSLRFHNAIWHGFVLTAALCHYAAVLTSLA
jgi:hemolysin III